MRGGGGGGGGGVGGCSWKNTGVLPPFHLTSMCLPLSRSVKVPSRENPMQGRWAEQTYVVVYFLQYIVVYNIT